MDTLVAQFAVGVREVAGLGLHFSRVVPQSAFKGASAITGSCAVSKLALACAALHQPVVENVVRIATHVFVEEAAGVGTLGADSHVVILGYREERGAVGLIGDDHDLGFGLVIDRHRLAEANRIYEEVRLALIAPFRGIALMTVGNIGIAWLAERSHRLLAILCLQLVMRVGALRRAKGITVLGTVTELVLARNALHQVVVVHLVWVEALHILVSDASILRALNAQLTVVV